MRMIGLLVVVPVEPNKVHAQRQSVHVAQPLSIPRPPLDTDCSLCVCHTTLQSQYSHDNALIASITSLM